MLNIYGIKSRKKLNPLVPVHLEQDYSYNNNNKPILCSMYEIFYSTLSDIPREFNSQFLSYS